jgi:hypothetical protein
MSSAADAVLFQDPRPGDDGGYRILTMHPSSLS